MIRTEKSRFCAAAFVPERRRRAFWIAGRDVSAKSCLFDPKRTCGAFVKNIALRDIPGASCKDALRGVFRFSGTGRRQTRALSFLPAILSAIIVLRRQFASGDEREQEGQSAVFYKRQRTKQPQTSARRTAKGCSV